jgi:hypothetical protein
MTFSSPFGQRIAMVIVLVAPLGLVHCGDDDGGSNPLATGGAVGSGGSPASGGGGAKATGGSSPTGGTKATTGGGTATGGGGNAGNAGGGTGGTSGGMGGAHDAGEAGASGGSDPVEGGSGGAAAGETGEGGTAGEGGGEEPTPLDSILIGTFAPLPAYSASEISGQAVLIRTATETRVSVQVLGLLDDTEYPVHVHNQPCEFLAGTHYKIDPAIAETEEENEVWPMFETNDEGVGMAEVTVDHLLRGDAMSVVVHDPETDGAPKMACADLTLDSVAPLTAKGTFNSFAQSEDQDETIEGSVELLRSEDGTEISYDLAGLDSDAEYMSHVHALPCDVMDAGGHYKFDPTNTETLEANELWLDLGSTDDGESTDSLTSEHRARLDAQSVVVHRMVDEDTVLKVACAPLDVEAYPDVVVEGTSVALDAAATHGLDDLQALGSLRRAIGGTTRVRVSAVGLGPSSSYPAHVHALPCSAQEGGPHYKIDAAEATTVEENELWLMVATDAEGAGTAEASFAHTARADARSIVIHDAEDGERLACIDLSP